MPSDPDDEGNRRFALTDIVPVDRPLTAEEQAAVRELLDRRAPGADPARLLHGDYTEAETVASARDRSAANARWWDGLSAAERMLVVTAHPGELGNADGIPAVARDYANRLSIVRDMAELRAVHTADRTQAQQVRLDNLETTLAALVDADRMARESDVGTPPVHLLSFDPGAFDGKGRAVLAFGDVDTADSVSWHVPGIKTDIGKLAWNADFARNHYEMTSRHDPARAVASIAWLGYGAPSGYTGAFRLDPARAGGALLARDIGAFNAAREARAPRGAPPRPDNHVFGHSYGSTTTSYAGGAGRLAHEVASITLAASPGAGPVAHASEFGVGDNVFVATMSTDKVTWVGGNRSGRSSRFLGVGVDPSIEAFGARRVAAEYPSTQEFADPRRHHTQYYDYLDASRTRPTEALDNFARIAAGLGDTVVPETRRPGEGDVGVLRRVIGKVPKVDPASTAHADDGTHGYRAVDGPDTRPAGPEVQGHRGGRGLWSENTLPGFEAAMRMGVDGIELDIGLTADGVPVVHHEQHIDKRTVRDTDPGNHYVGQRIRDLTLDQVRTLDTGVVHPSFADTQHAEPGTRIPTLAEVVRLAADTGWTGTFSVEIKTDPGWSDAEVRAVVAEAVRAMREHGGQFRILGFDWRVLTHAAQLAPEADRVALVSARTATEGWLGRDPGLSRVERARMLWAQLTGTPRDPGGDLAAAARDAGATILSPERSMVTEKLVAQARRAGVRVSAWTVNDPAEMHRLTALGVDAMVTDFPDRLRAVLEHRGRALPEAPVGPTLPTDPGFDAQQAELAARALARFPDSPPPRADDADPVVTTAARDRALHNQRVWESLDHAQREALLRAHPEALGTKDGIPAQVRDHANRLAHRRAWRELGARIAADPRALRRFGEKPFSGSEFATVRRLLFTDEAVQRAALADGMPDWTGRHGRALLRALGQDAGLPANLTAMSELLGRADREAAELPGAPPVHVLVFDPNAFHGDGRAVLALGDIDTAEQVAWHVPGLAATVGSMNQSLHAVRNLHEVTARSAPETSRATVLWLGYDPPSGDAMWSQYTSTGPAREGGRLLLGDLAAFDAVRAAGPSGSAVNHLIGHGYGTTAIGFAGADGGLAGLVADVTLVGSPGVGPVTEAGQFGLGADRVYALTASSDRLTWRGADTAAAIAGPDARALGVDPATGEFGAVRVAAEFPVAPRFAGVLAERHQYFWFTDPSRTTPTEALGELGRITAGQGAAVRTEPHRPGTRETIRFLDRDVDVPVDPAAERTGVVAPSRTQREIARAALDLLEPGTGPTALLHAEHGPGDHDAPTVERDAAAHTDRVARWWHEQLGDAERAALVRAHPFEIGNADGIPAAVRDQANRVQITRDFDAFLARYPQGARTAGLDAAETTQLRNLVRTTQALTRMDARAAAHPGSPPVHVLSYDRTAFGGTGRAVMAVGDIDTAESVSWIVPGITTTMEKLPGNLRAAMNMYEMTTRMNPDLRVASVIWIGYEAPNGASIVQNTVTPRAAQEGAVLLRRDLAAYRAAREYLAGRDDSAETSRVYLLAHSYGSVATGYAGRGGRLAESVEAIMLLGSPGAGPIQNASEYGVPVYVATSSGDPVTWAGADTPGRFGRFAGRGHGIDPSTRAFEATQRVTAEFPEGTAPITQHRGYFKYVDEDGARAVSTESLRNAALLAAERPGDMIPARPRPGLEEPGWRQRQVSSPNDPESTRVAVPFDATDTRGAAQQRHVPPPVDGTTENRAPRSRWRPARREAAPAPECALDALRVVAQALPEAGVRVPESVGPAGMTAAELEAAAGGRLRMYDSPARIAAVLKRMAAGIAPGQPAPMMLVVDEYRGATGRDGVGAHAYVLSWQDGRVMVHDRTLDRSPQPFRRGLVPSGLLATHGILIRPGGADRPVDTHAPGAHRPDVGIGARPAEGSAPRPWDAVEAAVRAKGEPVRYEKLPRDRESSDVYIVEFADGSRWVYKPVSGQTHGAIDVPASGHVPREVAAYRRSELLGYGLVPPTVAWTGRYGDGSLQELARVLPGRPLTEYSVADQHRKAVLDYLGADRDANSGNTLTAAGDARRDRGDMIAIDNEKKNPTDGDRIGIRSSSVVDVLGEPLDVAALGPLRALSPADLRAVLTELSLEPEAIDGEMRRLAEITEDGMITGRNWPGRIRDVPRVPPEPQVAAEPTAPAEPSQAEPGRKTRLWQRLLGRPGVPDAAPAPARSHPESGQQAPDGERYTNDCAPRAVRTIVELTGSEVARTPDRAVGPDGMSAGELEAAAGGRLQSFDSHDAVADLLLSPEMGHGAAVLVVDAYHGPADRHGVGSHAYVLYNNAGVIEVHDPGLGFPHDYQRGRPASDVAAVSGIVFDSAGQPVRPIDAHPVDESARPDSAIGSTDGAPRETGGPRRPLPDDAAEFIAYLRTLGADTAALGGTAANVYRATPRPTPDIDLMIREVGDLPAQLRADGYEVETFDNEDGEIYLIRLHGKGVEADLMVAETPVQSDLLDRAVGGVASVEDVIVLKLIANRAKDKGDIDAILAAGHRLDLDYIQRQAAEWEATRAWRDAQNRHGRPLESATGDSGADPAQRSADRGDVGGGRDSAMTGDGDDTLGTGHHAPIPGDRFDDCATAAEVAEILMAEHDLDVEGFDLPGIDVAAVREFARAVDEHLRAVPEVDLAAVRIEDLDDPDVVAEAMWVIEDGYAHTDSITLNLPYATDPGMATTSWANDLATSFRVGPPGRAVYGNIVHEFGHAVDHAGGMRARAEAPYVLFEAYTRAYPDQGDADWLPDYEDWLADQFSEYSFHADGTLDVAEALAEAYAAVAHAGPDATEGERVLNALLREHAREGNDVDPRFDPDTDDDKAFTAQPDPSGDGPDPSGAMPVPSARDIVAEQGDAAALGWPDRCSDGEPVDMATGAVLLEADDLRTDGDLPLHLRRVHVSALRLGRHFGPGWLSAFDERLEIDDAGVVLVRADGALLSYPHPEPGGAEVFPHSGPRLPLSLSDGTYLVRDLAEGTIREFVPGAVALGGAVVPITAVRHRGGRRLDYEYGADGSVSAVRHSGGAVLRTRTDPVSGRVTELSLASGDATIPIAAYRYSDVGDLLGVTNDSGRELRYTYDDAHRLLSWTDRNGVSYHHRYDERGRCVAQVGTGGVYANAFVYGDDDLPGAPRGGRCTVLVETVRALDTSPAGTADLDVDAVLDALRAMPAVREIERRGPRAAADRSVAREDAVFGRLRVLVFRADARGDVWQITDAVGGVRTFERDAAHQVVREVDPSGAATTYRRDDHGLITAVTAPDGSTTTITRGPWGEPRTEVGRGGRTWSYESDALGNTVAVVGPDGARESYEYELRDGGSALRRVIDPTGAVTEIRCDGTGLPVLVRTPGDRAWTYQRDPFGRIRTLTDPLGRATTYTWTPTGKPLGRRNPDGSTPAWTYDAEGNELSRTDEAGHTATTAYTVLDSPLEVTGQDGAVLRIGYDTQMQITSVTNPSGLVWRYEYDDAGRLIAETDYNGARTGYVHDSAGRIRSTTDATGRMTRFVYDAAGRVQEEHTDDGVTAYRYDRHGDLIEAANPDAVVRITRDAAGRVLTERTGDITVAVEYDRAGRRTQRIVDTRAVQEAGLGRRAVFGRDEAGQLVSVAVDDGLGPADIVRFGYDRAGNETTRGIGAAVLDRRYDERDRIIAQHVRTGAGVVAGRTWSYRADGYVTGGQDLVRGARRIELDPAGRITAAVSDQGPIPAERYGYDRAGVLTMAADPEEPALPGRVLSTGTLVTELGRRRFGYDAAGRLVRVVRTRLSHKPEVFEFTHTATGRIRTVAAPDGTFWRYGYDAFGRRVSKVRTDRAGTVLHTVVFGWDGDELVFQQDRSGGPAPSVGTWHWVHHPETGEPLTQYSRTSGPAPDPGVPVARADQSAVDTEFYAIVTDLAGAPTELIDPHTGTVAGWASATVWGRTWWNGRAGTALRFAGQYHDAETGLHYNRHRYYDPVTAAYTTPDPLGLAPNPANPHAYVHNPHTWVDPLGLAGCGNGWWRTLRTFGPIGAARQEYVDTVRAITERGLARVAAGEDAGDVARWAIDERNAMKTATRAKLPRVLNIWAERRNIRHYGDPVGPTYEFLHDVRGKTPMDIIKGAGRTSAQVNRLLGVR